MLPRCGCVHKHEPGDWTVLGGVGGPTDTEQGTRHLVSLQIEDDDGVDMSMYRYGRPLGIHAECVFCREGTRIIYEGPEGPYLDR